jgi:chloramphenicol 3-O-phosphotransferase
VIAALVLIGAPGAGKSAVLDALSTLLEAGGVEHGAIESEELARGFPLLQNSLLVEQLTDALAVQRRAGRRLFLIAFTAESEDELSDVLAGVGAPRSLVACLRAPAEALAARLQAREPDRWPGKAALVAHARELAEVVPALEGIDLRLDTEGRDAEDLARTVLAAMRERGLL